MYAIRVMVGTEDWSVEVVAGDNEIIRGRDLAFGCSWGG